MRGLVLCKVEINQPQAKKKVTTQQYFYRKGIQGHDKRLNTLIPLKCVYYKIKKKTEQSVRIKCYNTDIGF